MPRVTISINAPNEAADQDLLTLDLPPGLTVKDLKGFVEAESSFPAQSQNFFLNGQPLNNDLQTLDAAGVKDGEMLAVLIRRPGNGAQGQRRGGGADGPEIARQAILNNPDSHAQLRQHKPNLLAAIHDPDRFREEYLMEIRLNEEAERERQNQLALLNEDPFNPDNQRRIEEIIRQERVIDNLQHAIEHTPEVFARVHMLYVNTEVNGHPIKAFVDSGAQATIMSPSCAEKCGIMRLIDTRYSGVAVGVGTARILGRVHHAEIKIGGAVLPCAFTVMEGKSVDLLFGLDMLKRYKAKIDLEKNALCFEDIEVPFLAEHELPKEIFDAEVKEPTVPGPDGTEIGASSGAVRPKDPATRSGAVSSTSAGNAAPKAPVAPAPENPSAPADEFPAEHVKQLMTTLNIPRQQAIQALRAANGNVELAASLFFGE